MNKRICLLHILGALILLTGECFAFDKCGEDTEWRQAEAWVEGVYRLWMQKGGSDSTLAERMFTEEMSEKLTRMSPGTDPVVQAQDFSDYGIRSIKCEHLTDDWFKVSYQWDEMEKPKEIPLRLEKVDSGYRINYILPEWASDVDYDTLFNVNPCDTIVRNDAFQFVKTFYCNYTHLYAEMQPDLQQKLSEMRERFCTSDLLQRINAEKELSKYDMDGSCFDHIIRGCDFDVCQIGTLDVLQVSDTRFEISYKLTEDFVNKWVVGTTLLEDGWKISEIIP